MAKKKVQRRATQPVHDFCATHHHHVEIIKEIKEDLKLTKVEVKKDIKEINDELKRLYKDIYIKIGVVALLIALAIAVIGKFASVYIDSFVNKKTIKKESK